MSSRALVLLVPVVTYLSFQLYFFRPLTAYWIAAFLVILSYATIRSMIKEGQAGLSGVALFLLPAYLSLAVMLFTSLVSDARLIQSLFIAGMVILYIYFRLAYFYLIRISDYHTGSIAEFSSQANCLAFYLVASTIYGLQSFLNPPLWMLVLPAVLFFGLITYQTMSVNGIDGKRGMFYILLACLVLSELSWSLTFLSLSYYVSGFILTVFYFVLIGFLRLHLTEGLPRKTVILYLIFGVASVASVLLTSKWI